MLENGRMFYWILCTINWTVICTCRVEQWCTHVGFNKNMLSEWIRYKLTAYYLNYMIIGKILQSLRNLGMMQIVLNCSQPWANQYFLVSFYFKELSIWGIFFKRYVQPFINVLFWISYAYLFNVKYFAGKSLYQSTVYLSTS